jgi:hypothetical protein
MAKPMAALFLMMLVPAVSKQEATMIQLLNDTFQVMKTFKSDEGLYAYLKERESFKWHLSRYPYKSLVTFVQEMKEASFVYMAFQAVQQQQDLIVVCKGDEENPSLFLATSDLDIAALTNEWNKQFCAAHGMYILRE